MMKRFNTRGHPAAGTCAPHERLGHGHVYAAVLLWVGVLHRQPAQVQHHLRHLHHAAHRRQRARDAPALTLPVVTLRILPKLLACGGRMSSKDCAFWILSLRGETRASGAECEFTQQKAKTNLVAQ